LRHAKLDSHGGQLLPPQSTSVSLPFMILSSQAGVEHLKSTQIASTQLLSTKHSTHVPMPSQNWPPLSAQGFPRLTGATWHMSLASQYGSVHCMLGQANLLHVFMLPPVPVAPPMPPAPAAEAVDVVVAGGAAPSPSLKAY
jgi:hypothetical protein